MRHAPCPMSELRVNGPSTLVDSVSQVIYHRLGHFDAYCNYWSPL
jgi:hypothetical protein